MGKAVELVPIVVDGVDPGLVSASREADAAPVSSVSQGSGSGIGRSIG